MPFVPSVPQDEPPPPTPIAISGFQSINAGARAAPSAPVCEDVPIDRWSIVTPMDIGTLARLRGFSAPPAPAVQPRFVGAALSKPLAPATPRSAGALGPTPAFVPGAAPDDHDTLLVGALAAAVAAIALGAGISRYRALR
jgi:hypothetical protein